MRQVQDIAAELYALPPQAFTAARDGYVVEAKRAGDRAAAAQLSAMKRPSVAAWLVNLIALRVPESLERLIVLGEDIRQAQGNVPPAQLRDLSAQRRREIDALLAQARTFAAAIGEAAPAKQHMAEVEATLAAAMADPAAAELVRSGRVLKALSYTGFGASFGAPPGGGVSVGRAASAAAPPDAVAASTGAPAVDVEATERQADARLAAAEERLAEARRALAAAVQAEEGVNRTAQRIAGQIAELRDRLDEAQRGAREARQARLAAERDLASAERRLAKVTTTTR